MHYILLEKSSGLYVCSVNSKVLYPDFARKFNSVEKAKLFLSEARYDKNKYEIIQRDDYRR
ncbi:MAG: hypothetical protein IKO47_10075 [Ruminococcus sp.]|nr:hypothetical protein [Ruminococcus sp.]